MRSNLGLAGKAFITQRMQLDLSLGLASLIPEEKDLGKLKLSSASSALAIPLKS
jgi:hypothetical protein